MSNITLAEFQIKAISDLMEAMENDKRDIVLKSPTGSGKTIILTHFMDEYTKSNSNTVFIWLTPGKGNLEEQSKEKMDKYIYGAQTKLLSEVMISGFEENDCCFINWEKLTKKGNNALKDSERTNFLEHIEQALDKGLHFIIIVDESQVNDTIKADEILQYFKTNKIIRTSATPKNYTNADLIEINEAEVIAAGLIKKVLIINENFDQDIRVKNQTEYLLDKALAKQQEIRSELLKRGAKINPLIVVQIPNKNKTDVLQDEIERYMESKGITYENNQLAVWLSDKKQNLEHIDANGAESVAVIIKQAVATGWDCPRAWILVKLRENMDETFEIQTIGRIRRMPEVKHYGNDLLDSCYLYTLDEKFTEGVKTSMGKDALNACTLYLKNAYKDFSLVSEQRSGISVNRDAVMALKVIAQYFAKKYGTASKKEENRKLLEANGYVFNNEIINYTKSGEVRNLNQGEIQDLNDIRIRAKLNTHQHGRQYHHDVSAIGLKIGLEYSLINTIVRKLFDENVKSSYKILNLKTREVYAFVLNNEDKLKDDIRHAMAEKCNAEDLGLDNITEVKFTFPRECLFTYNGSAKTQNVREKNVYQDYLSSAEPRSNPEKKFETACENSNKVDWTYKNGDKGEEYFSIVYDDSFGKRKLFYPDYVVSINGEVWIIETKGGFDRSGNSQDIDIFSPRKFEVLKKYLKTHHLKGGFVREDAETLELCICTDNYSDNIKSDDWKLLNEII